MEDFHADLAKVDGQLAAAGADNDGGRIELSFVARAVTLRGDREEAPPCAGYVFHDDSCCAVQRIDLARGTGPESWMPAAPVLLELKSPAAPGRYVVAIVIAERLLGHAELILTRAPQVCSPPKVENLRLLFLGEDRAFDRVLGSQAERRGDLLGTLFVIFDVRWSSPAQPGSERSATLRLWTKEHTVLLEDRRLDISGSGRVLADVTATLELAPFLAEMEQDLAVEVVVEDEVLAERSIEVICSSFTADGEIESEHGGPADADVYLRFFSGADS